MAPIKFAYFGSLADQTLDQEYAITSWSFIHLLSGLVLGFACWQFHKDGVLSYGWSTTLSVAAIALWEPFEQVAWTEEHLMNSMTDLLVGFVALFVVLLVVEAE